MNARRTRAVRVAAAAYALALGLASLLPSGRTGLGRWDAEISPTVQNALHVPAYGALTVLAWCALAPTGSPGVLRTMAIAAGCLGYGLLLELAQAVIPGRTASLADALLNAGGAVVGAALVGIIFRRAGAVGRPGVGSSRAVQHGAGSVTK